MSDRLDDEPPTALNRLRTYQASDCTPFHVAKTEEDPQIGRLCNVQRHDFRAPQNSLQSNDGLFRKHGIKSKRRMTWLQILDSL